MSREIVLHLVKKRDGNDEKQKLCLIHHCFAFNDGRKAND
jgi:hypothetical protein